MAALDRHRRNGYSIESFVVNQRGSPVGIKKKIKKELIGTSDYPSNKIFTISNFITFTRLILTLVFLYLFVTDNNRVVAIVIYAIAASTDWMDGQIARMTKTVSWLGKVMDPICDRALLFTGVRVNSYSSIENAVILPYVNVGRHARLKNVVVDRGVTIPEGLVVGESGGTPGGGHTAPRRFGGCFTCQRGCAPARCDPP